MLSEEGVESVLRVDEGILERNVINDVQEVATFVQQGSDEEFVSTAAPGPLKKAKVAEFLTAAEPTNDKAISPNHIVENGGDEIDGCPICYEPWTSSGMHRVCSLRCGHLFGKQ